MVGKFVYYCCTQLLLLLSGVPLSLSHVYLGRKPTNYCVSFWRVAVMSEGSYWCCRGVTREVVLIMKTSGLLICSAVETCQIGSCLLSEGAHHVCLKWRGRGN